MNTESPGNRNRSHDERRDPEPDAIVQKTHDVASNIKEATLQRVDSVRQSAQALRDDTSHRVRDLSAAMRKVGEHFRIEDQQYIADKMTGVSKHVTKLADYVDTAEVGSLVRDLRGLARRNPTMFLGGAFLVGLGAGRFFKGTSLTGSTVPSARTEAKTLRREVEADDGSALYRTGQERRPANRASNMNERTRTDRDF